jgi:LacI family transcriptional regulator
MQPSPRPRRISIRDVAERAGVSLGSASRVINEVAGVAPELRERVLAAIAELGYRPNHAAQSLRLRSTHTIGCMLTDVTNPLYGQLFHALEEKLRAAGYVVLLANSLNKAEREIDILRTFRDRRMDGVIIAPGNERDPAVLAAAQSLDVPTVVMDRDMLPGCDRVQFDHVPGMRAVAAHLAGLGHKRVALVLSSSGNRPMRRRIEGFRAGLLAHGITADDELILQMPGAMSSSYSAISLLLERPRRPTALVLLGTNILNEALNAIGTHSLRIPQDISVVSIGDPDFARSFQPPITALRVDLDQAAEQAVAMLLDRLAHGDAAPPRTVKVLPDFIVRQSCGPAPKPRGKAA